MTAYERLRFPVGDRAADDTRRVELEGYALTPRGPAKGALVLSTGLTALARHYLRLLKPLAEEYRVIAYSHRGHGTSEGVLDPAAAPRDLEAIVAQAGLGKPVLIGHSFGGYVTGVASRVSRGCFWLAPYLGPAVLSPFKRLGLAALNAARPLLSIPDAVIENTGLGPCLGTYNRRPLGATARMREVRPPRVDVPLACLLAGRDEMVHPARARATLAHRYPGAESHDTLRTYLKPFNHCFNIGFRDWFPFCKPERHHGARVDKQPLIEAVARFAERCYASELTLIPGDTFKKAPNVA